MLTLKAYSKVQALNMYANNTFAAFNYIGPAYDRYILNIRRILHLP